MLGNSYLFLVLSTLLVLSSALNAQDQNYCLNLPNDTYSQCNLKDKHLTCFGGFDDKYRVDNVQTLILCNWSEESFDAGNILKGFHLLRKLVIANSNMTKLSSSFPSEAEFLESIVIIGTKLCELYPGSFNNLANLRVLDLRNNALEEIIPEVFNIASLSQLYLFGNPLKCTENATWVLDSREESFVRKLVDKDELRCASPYEDRPLIPVVEVIQTLKQECQKTVCECKLVYVVGRAGKQVQKQLIAFVEVNCSRRGLTEMPSFLPANTTALRLTGNNVKDLTPLTTNPVYENVIDVYLDENLIESIVELESSRWLDNFRLLNLRGNRLTDLPTYALENVLLHSANAASLYLGNNPWTCDCLFTPSFQDLLIRYTNLMKDINDIRCASVNGDDNSNKQIRDLTRTEICISSGEDPLLHPLDILSIVLAALILLIVGKLLYDYWSFKKTGKLPWIVAKIP